MKDFLLKLWKNEEGAETVEYIVIVAVLLIVAGAVYFGTGGLQGGLTTALGQITTFLGSISIPAP